MSADNPYAAPEATDHIAPDDGYDVPDDMGGITRGQFWLGYLGSIIVGFLIAFLFPQPFCSSMSSSQLLRPSG